MGLSWASFLQIHIVHLYSKASMVNNDIYEEVAVLYTSKKFLAYPSVPIHEGHGMAKMVSPGCFESRYL